eukprot:IDg63t1
MSEPEVLQKKEETASIAFMASTSKDIRNRWFLDSCCSSHLTNQRWALTDYKKSHKHETVSTASDQASDKILGTGTIYVEQEIDGRTHKLKLNDVGFAPDL